MPKTVKINLSKKIYEVYQTKGLEAAYQWVRDYNMFNNNVISYERCEGCDTKTPSIKHECCICGQETKVQGKPKFYQAVLKPIKDVMNHVYPQGGSTVKERMGSEEATCPECGNNEWMLLAHESVAVKQGGKAYCECLGCGMTTHL